jgi:hypothetical protein
MRGWGRSALVAAALVAMVDPASAGPQSAPGVWTKDIGTVRQNTTIRGRDGGWSATWSGRSVWSFGDTALTVPGHDDDNWADNTLSWTADLDASDGITLAQDLVDATGAPTEAIPLTEEEALYNEQHAGNNCQVEPCNAEYALWGGPVIPDPARNRIILGYLKIHRIIGHAGWRTIGSGFAVWTPGGGVVRPVESPGSPDPTLMFRGDGPTFIEGPILVGGTLHNYGCVAGFLVQNCEVARVPVADALDRRAWEYYAGGGRWSSHLSDAVTVFQGGAANSVFWDAYLGRYVDVYSQPVSNDVMYRTAPAPEGPWSDDTLLFEGWPGAPGSIDYFGLAHPEYGQDGGRVQYVTYVRTTGFLKIELRLVKVVFGPP